MVAILVKLSFHHPTEALYEIWLQSARWFQRRREKQVENLVTLGSGQEITITIDTHVAEFIYSFSWLHLPTFRSQAAIVSEKFIVFTFFPYKSPSAQIQPRPKIGQRQPRVIIWTNYGGPMFQMLQTMFQGNRPIGFGEDF